MTEYKSLNENNQENNNKLVDDNFESIEFNSNDIDKYNKNIFKSYDNIINDNKNYLENTNIIESFSNSTDVCPLVYGDEMVIYNRNKTKILENSDADLIFIPKPDYPDNFYFISIRNKLGKLVKYGEELFLSHKTRDAGRIRLRIVQGKNNNKKDGEVVYYKDSIQLINDNNNVQCIPHMARGKKCSTEYPIFIEDGNYKIKEIKVRTDDFFEMFIDGRIYRGSGWNRVFTFRDVPTKSNKGFTIGVNVHNGGGPSGFICQIKLTNGSIIVSDNSWRAAERVKPNRDYFIRYTNTYDIDSWVLPNIIGLNQNGKKRFDGRNYPGTDRAYTDSRFSKLAYWIWSGPCMRSNTSVYLAKRIGEPPNDDACAHNLTNVQAICYLQRYGDVRRWATERATTYKKEFRFSARALNWWQHLQEARRMGMDLACFNNAEELNEGHRLTRGSYYIGAKRIRGARRIRRRYGPWWRRRYVTYNVVDGRYNRTSRIWEWVDRSRWSYHNFVPHYEPNNYRDWGETVINVYSNKQWNDINPGNRLYALYQKKVRVRPRFIDVIYWGKWHWKNYGCHEGRTYDCLKPPSTVGNFDYEGCYLNNYNDNIIPTYRGRVRTFGECARHAERNRDRVFGLINRGQCYTSNNYDKATENPMASECFQKGGPGRGKFQVFYRKKPYDPLDPKLSNKNFNIDSLEKFSNKSKDPKEINLSDKNFDIKKLEFNKKFERFLNPQTNGFKLSKNNIILIIIFIIIIFLIFYCCKKN